MTLPAYASHLYRRIGRKPPPPGEARVPPPSARVFEADYVRHVKAFWALWSSRVEGIARAELGSRHDASVNETLVAAFDELLRASALPDFMARLVARMSARTADYVQRVTKLPPGGIARQQMIEDFRRRNLSLITSLRDEQIQRVGDILRPAAATGARWEDVASDVQDRLGVGLSRAKLIARDQTSKLNGQLQQAHQEAAGITEYTWSTAGDEAVRPDHRRLNGRRFRFDDPPVVNQATGERRNPGGDIQCRCVAVPVIPLFEGV